MSKRGLVVALVVGLVVWWWLRPKAAVAAVVPGAGTPYPPGTSPVDVQVGPITVISYE